MTSVDNIFKLPKNYVFVSREKHVTNHLKHFCRAVWSQGTLELKKGLLSLVDATAFRNKDHLVAGFKPTLKKVCSSNWIISPGRGEYQNI